jgi:Ca2+/Na+ antiporter
MENIDKFITKYGDTIAKQLQIATTELHEKLIWYLRIDGILGLINAFLFLVFGAIYWIIFYKKIKKIASDQREDDRVPVYFLGVLVAGMFFFFVTLLMIGFTSILTDNLSKIFAPDYWLIKQTIELAQNKI